MQDAGGVGPFDRLYERLSAVPKRHPVLGRLSALKGESGVQKAAEPILPMLKEYAIGPLANRELGVKDLDKIRLIRRKIERNPEAMAVEMIAGRVLELKAQEAMLSVPVSQLLSDFHESDYALADTEYAYLVTNENGVERVFDSLERREGQGSVMLGVSGLYNLDLFVRMDLSDLVVVDLSPQTERLWQIVAEVVANADTHEQALKLLLAEVEAAQEELFVDLVTMAKDDVMSLQIKGLKRHVESGASWLSSKERFEKVKQMFADGRFCFKRLDLCDAGKVSDLRERLQGSGHQIDTVYVSNIEEYAKLFGKEEAFKGGMKHLVTEGASQQVVYSGHHQGGTPRQSVIPGGVFLESIAQ